MYMYMYVYIYIYIYVGREREREREIFVSKVRDPPARAAGVVPGGERGAGRASRRPS